MLTTLTEILSEKHYCMRPNVFEALRSQILHNIDTHTASGIEKEQRQQTFAVLQHGELIDCPQSLLDFQTQEELHDDFYGAAQGEDSEVNPNENAGKQYINIVRLSGPMTRGGGDCSYGSKDHRDMMMEAADTPGVVAHIIYTSTPGGAASTIRDYRKAINYCHERGQKVYMYCDGDVASGGAFLACLCDEVWTNNPEDEIGSLGMYCAFFTMANGAKNKITSEVYRELYADASTDKNGWYRKAATGDMVELREDLNKDLAQMLANAKKDRPAVKDEQMTGKMYKMADVEGSLVDRFGSLASLCQHASEEYNEREGAAVPAKEQAEAPQQNTNPNKKNQMKTYSNIAAMIGEEAYESQADGYLSLNEEQADALETRAGEVAMMQSGFNAVSAELKAAKTMVEQLTKELEETKAALETAQQKTNDEEALEAAQKELEDSKTALETVTAERDNAQAELKKVQEELTTVQAELTNANDDLEAKENDLTAAQQTIEDLQQTIANINGAPANTPNTGEAPKTNGTNANVPQMKVNAYEWNPALSVSENFKMKEQYDKELQALALGGHK